MSIVVPYRDREQHLKKFIPHINLFLKDKVEYKIVVVEQNNNKPFNRGLVKNIGFDLSKKNCDYTCFHDVDLLPISSDCDYSYTESVTKLAIYVSQFSFRKRNVQELGGVVLFDNKVFELVNGFSNNYWGWGLEDDDLGERCKKKNVSLHSRDGRYMSLPHKTEGDTTGGKTSLETLNNRVIFESAKKDEKILFSSGLNNLNYEVNSFEEMKTHIHIKVDF